MSRTAVAAIAVVAAPALIACGDSDDDPSRAELPAPLARAFDRLDRAGMEPETLRVGVDQRPAVVVDAGEPIVLAASEPGERSAEIFSLSPALHDGESIDVAITLICRDGVVAGPSGAAGAKQRVIRVSGFCGAG